MRNLLLGRLERARRRLEELAQRRSFRLPLEGIREHERRLDEGADRLHRAVRQTLRGARDRLEAQAARLETLSPLNVLGRGYSLTRRQADGIVVRSPDQVQAGERLVTRLQHGQVFSRVEALEEDG
jgi:exodeoxyribonuclease VII large subunit